MSAGEHAHGEEFPRHETAELVGAALKSEQRRWKIQVALVALGITALVLGLPTRHLGEWRMEHIWPTARGEWTGLHLVPAVCARALTALTGWRSYQAWYFVSAAATGGTAVVLLGMARRRDARPLRAICLTLLALLVPMAWLAATIPDAASCELLGAAWLFSALDHERDEHWTRRATLAWIGASLLHAWNVYAWPAYALALLQRRRSNVPIAFAALLAWPAIVAGAWLWEHGTADWQSFLATSWRAMLASGSGGWGPLLAWFLVWAVGLGVGTLGILRVLHVTLRHPERRPPVWVFLFALVPLVVLGLTGFIGEQVPWLWLVPVAFLGLLDGNFVPAWVLVVLSAAGIVWVREVNDDDDWFNLVVIHVHPDDLVIAADIVHTDVLWGLKIDAIPALVFDVPNVEFDIDTPKDLTDRIEAARAAHRRIVIDVREPTSSHPEWIRLGGPNFKRLRDQGAVDLDELPP